MFRNILLVGLGGAIGSIARYLVNVFIDNKTLPIATFTVNIIGSFLIGVIMGFIAKHTNSQTWQLFLITGFCGGFTTFSALSWDVVLMIQQQRFGTAIFYITATVFLGLLFAFLGFWCSK